MSHIEKFKSALNNYHDLARSDRFEVWIFVPSMLQLKHAFVVKNIAMLCEQAELPGRTLATFDARTYGPTIKYPYQGIYTDIQLSFYTTGNLFGVPGKGLTEKTFFDDWMELINPTPQSQVNAPYNFEYKDFYSSTIYVNHYDTDQKKTYSVKLIDAYPIAVNPIPLSWSDESIPRLSVQFAYTRWERITDLGLLNLADILPINSALTDIISTASFPTIPGVKPLQNIVRGLKGFDIGSIF